jgi:hypothetical protein
MNATATLTRHTHAVVFGRKVDGCPRCAELAAGRLPRTWGGREYDPKARRRYLHNKRLTEAMFSERYCFCPETPLWAGRCDRCGRPPYTD